MKKIVLTAGVLSLVLSLCACGSSAGTASASAASSAASTSSAAAAATSSSKASTEAIGVVGPSDSIEDQDYTAYVISPSGVNVREEANTESNILNEYELNSQLHVTGVLSQNGTPTGWLRVDAVNGEGTACVGYVKAEFLSTDPASTDVTVVSVATDDGTVYTAEDTDTSSMDNSDAIADILDIARDSGLFTDDEIAAYVAQLTELYNMACTTEDEREARSDQIAAILNQIQDRINAAQTTDDTGSTEESTDTGDNTATAMDQSDAIANVIDQARASGLFTEEEIANYVAQITAWYNMECSTEDERMYRADQISEILAQIKQRISDASAAMNASDAIERVINAAQDSGLFTQEEISDAVSQLTYWYNLQCSTDEERENRSDQISAILNQLQQRMADAGYTY